MDSYAEMYRTVYAPHVVGQRTAGESGAVLTRICQPAGHFPDPSTPDLVLQAQLSRCLPGEIDIGAGRFRCKMKRGHLVLAPPNATGDYLLEGAHELLTLSIPYRNLLQMAPAAGLPYDGSFGRLHSDQFFDAFIPVALNRMWDEAAEGNPHGALFADGAVLAIAGALLARAGLPREPIRGGLAPHVLKRVVEHIMDRLGDEVQLTDLAAVADLSPGHFSTAFRHSTGQPPHRFLTSRRLERAKELIRTGVILADVATECGFASQQHLTTLFRKEVGITPGQWRRHNTK